jgi:hypothetical protein
VTNSTKLCGSLKEVKLQMWICKFVDTSNKIVVQSKSFLLQLCENVDPNGRHALCDRCLLTYSSSLVNNSEAAELENLFPVRCCIPDCKTVLSRKKLFRALKLQADGVELISKIEETELKVGLLQLAQNEDAFVSCTRCSYFEVFELSPISAPKFFVCKKCPEMVTVCINCKNTVQYGNLSAHNCTSGIGYWKLR